MLSATERSTINKAPHKAGNDQQQLYQVIDESLIGHIAIQDARGPVVIPMLAWRVDNNIYVHGAKNSRLIKQLKTGSATCLTFTLFDGWILARSAFHHSAHYRSAVVFGEFTEVTERDEKDRVLNHFLEQIAPKRTEHVRLSNDRELAATDVLVMPLTEASVKISNNDPSDDASDMDSPTWAGIMPYRTVVGPLIPAPDLIDGVETPDYSSGYPERWHNRTVE